MHISKALTNTTTILLGVLSYNCEGRDDNEAEYLRSSGSIYSNLLSASYTELYHQLDTFYDGDCQTDVGGQYGLEEILVKCTNGKGSATLTADQHYHDKESTAIPFKLEVCTDDGPGEDPNNNNNKNKTSRDCNTLVFTGKVGVDVDAAKQLLQGYQVTLFEELTLLLNATYQGVCHSNSILLMGAPSNTWVECDLPDGVSAKLSICDVCDVIPTPISLEVCTINPYDIGTAPTTDKTNSTTTDTDGDCKSMNLDSAADDDGIKKQLKEAGTLLQTWL